MTKKEMAMFEKLMDVVDTLTNRIDALENSKSTSRTVTVEYKDSKKSTKKVVAKPIEIPVGNLIFSGILNPDDTVTVTSKIVRTGSNYMPSSARYAIGKSVEEFNGEKLKRSDEIVKKFAKKDKYVQVYEFKTVEDCVKFKSAQESRLSK